MKFVGEVELTFRYYVELEADSEESAIQTIKDHGAWSYVETHGEGGLDEVKFYLEEQESSTTE